MSEDKRISKTKNAIRSALLAQMKYKKWQDISVSSLCDDANIGRGTFYSHYNNVYDAEKDLEDEFVSTLREAIFRYFDFGDTYTLPVLIRDILIYIKNDTALYLAFIDGEQADLQDEITNNITEMFYYHNLKYNKNMDDTSAKYSAILKINGITSVISQWIADDCRMSIEQLTQIIYAVVAPQ